MATTNTSTEQSKQAASEVAGKASQHAEQVKGRAREEARSVADDAKDQAGQVLQRTQDEFRSRAAEQTSSLASTLDDVGRQLGDMADSAQDPQAQAAQLVRSASDQASQWARRLDEGGIDGLVHDVKRFARNRPGAFLLGSVVAGFAVGRLGKHADLQRAGQQAKSEARGSEDPAGSQGEPNPLSAGDRSGRPTSAPTVQPTPTTTTEGLR